MAPDQHLTWHVRGLHVAHDGIVEIGLRGCHINWKVEAGNKTWLGSICFCSLFLLAASLACLFTAMGFSFSGPDVQHAG